MKDSLSIPKERESLLDIFKEWKNQIHFIPVLVEKDTSYFICFSFLTSALKELGAGYWTVKVLVQENRKIKQQKGV